jgi:hypothetical protein
MEVKPAIDMVNKYKGIIVGIKCAPFVGPEWTPYINAEEIGKDEIQVLRHGRELAAHGQQREMESTIEHGPNFGIERARRTIDSQRTANSGLTGCLSLGVHFIDVPNNS